MTSITAPRRLPMGPLVTCGHPSTRGTRRARKGRIRLRVPEQQKVAAATDRTSYSGSHQSPARPLRTTDISAPHRASHSRALCLPLCNHPSPTRRATPKREAYAPPDLRIASAAMVPELLARRLQCVILSLACTPSRLVIRLPFPIKPSVRSWSGCTSSMLTPRFPSFTESTS